MGGGIAATFARVLKLDAASVRLLLMAGVAAGFGSIFGTPIAGAVFALEVLVIGRMQYDALIPCFIASLVADWTCGAWGIGHTHYHVAVASAGLAAGFRVVRESRAGRRRLRSRGSLVFLVFAQARGCFQALHPASRAAAGGGRAAGDRVVFPLGNAGLSRARRHRKPAGCHHAARDVHLHGNSGHARGFGSWFSPSSPSARASRAAR